MLGFSSPVCTRKNGISRPTASQSTMVVDASRSKPRRFRTKRFATLPSPLMTTSGE